MSRAGVGTFVMEDHELASSGLALFDVPIVDKSLVYGKFLTIYPTFVLLTQDLMNLKFRVMVKNLLIYLILDWKVV